MLEKKSIYLLTLFSTAEMDIDIFWYAISIWDCTTPRQAYLNQTVHNILNLSADTIRKQRKINVELQTTIYSK